MKQRGTTAGLEAGQLVDGRYRVVRELGRGGMGSVYRADDVHLERPVAIKLARTELSWALARFQREAASLATIRNEHVVAVHAYGFHPSEGGDRSPFFVMEYVRGENLASIVEQHRRASAQVPLYRGVEIVTQVAQGLAAVHASGVIHGDIKSENVVIERGTGRPVLVDFGLAHDVERELRGGDSDEPMLGTPHYVAPELYWEDDARPTALSDIYALGVVAYELLTGVMPFDAAEPLTILEMQRDVLPLVPSAFRPELAPLDDVLMHALAKNPQERPQTAAAFAAQLGAVARHLAQQLASDVRISETAGESSSGSLDVPRILIIDDEPVFAKLASRCARLAFGDAPVEVVTVSSGPEGIAAARRRIPQLIILDYALPDLNGVDVLSRIRSITGGEETEVLVVSGEAGAAERWRFGILGVRDFINKPVELTRLVDAIGKVCRRRGWLTWNGTRPRTVY